MNRTQWTMALLVLVTGTAFGQGRQELSLSGEWEYVKVADLTTPPTEGWTAIHVPGLLSGMDYERAWFRRDFQIPESMRGARVVLHFGGVKYNSVVRVNGQKVGGYFGGWTSRQWRVLARPTGWSWAAVTGQASSATVRRALR